MKVKTKHHKNLVLLLVKVMRTISSHKEHHRAEQETK